MDTAIQEKNITYLIVHTQNTSLSVGALSCRNEYDGHALQKSLEQAAYLRGKTPTAAASDSGYRGIQSIGQRSASIETPVIGHLMKADNRLSCNFYKGIFGDNISVMLSAAAFNFKTMMNKRKSSFVCLFENFAFLLQMFINPFLLQEQIAKKSF